METIHIGSAGHPDQVRQRLEFEAQFLRDEGFQVDISESTRGSVSFFRLDSRATEAAVAFGSPEDQASLVRQHLANAISDLIVNVWEEDLLLRLVSSEYRTLGENDRALIVTQAQALLDGGPERAEAGLLRKVGRKGHILREVAEYLETEDLLVIEGFINFRLQRYVDHLETIVEQAVDEFMLQKEYREFILLLRHFLTAQEPRIERVHVLVSPDGGFRLLDDEGTSISDQYLEESLSQAGQKEINRDDLLISALITIAPRRLKLHALPGIDNDGLRTLRAVFADRVTICRGCELCGLRVRRPYEEHEHLFH
ncbi:MAG: putative sporulation protein YtxC [Bacillota bacterium]|nr:putative sporulation protein YtxC [Bacillota bacterium]